MSCQRGNASRSRAQKHQNHIAFKNDLYDTSRRTKFINSIEVANVCERCKKIIEWKIKYKKYKPLSVPAKCTKCEQKNVMHAYHTMCSACARQREICPKCGERGEIVGARPSREEQTKVNSEVEIHLQRLLETNYRLSLYYLNQIEEHEENNKEDISGLDGSEVDGKDASGGTAQRLKSREDLLKKLKSLAIAEGKDENFE